MEPSRRSGWTRTYFRTNLLLLAAVHLGAFVGVIITGWSWRWAACAVIAYYLRMIAVTAGYHRYFAHRAFRTSRVFQFLLAVAAQSAAQRGVLWWASHHRWHHKHSDTPQDVHSVRQRGFWYAHMGWIVADAWNATDTRLVPDLLKFPELRWLDRPLPQLLPTSFLGLAFLLIGGLPGFVWGFLLSTVMVWHGSFSVNSLAHLFGKRRYETGDDSRNSWLLAVLMTGEGWHNNHHHYQGSARQGFFWWEIDVTYYVLRLLALVGLVWDLREVPSNALAGPRVQEIGCKAA